MLQFLVNNTPLVLDPKTQIRYEENFPYFDNEGIPASTVWHFDVPVIGNEETFRYANYIMLKNKVRLYSCTIKVHGIPLGRGKLTLVNAGEAFRVSVLINDFAVQFKDVTINTMADSNFVLGTSMAQRLAIAKEINAGNVEAPFRFPMVYAPEFYGGNNDDGKPENNPEFLRYLNNWDSLANVFVPNENNYVNKNTLVPFLFLQHIIENILWQKKWQFAGAVTQHHLFKQLLVHNNCALDEPMSQYRVYASAVEPLAYGLDNTEHVIEWDMILVDETETFTEGIYNCPVLGRYEINMEIDLFDQFGYPMNAEIRVFQDENLTYNSIKFTGGTGNVSLLNHGIEVTSLPCTVKFMVWAENLTIVNIDITSYIEIKSVAKIRNELTNIDYNNHVPNVNITTLLNTIRHPFGAALFFDSENRRVEMEFMNNILADKQNALDITPFVVVGSIESEFPEETPVVYKFTEDVPKISEFKYTAENGYRLPRLVKVKNMYGLATAEQSIYKSEIDSTTFDLNWVFESFNYGKFQSKPTATDPEGIEISVLPTPMTSFYNNRLMPYYDSKGQSAYNEQTEPMPLVVSVWGGGVNIKGYPFATSVAHYQMALTSFNFGGTKSLNQFVEKWALWQQTREEVRLQLVGIGIWEMLELIRLNRPARGSQPQQRWLKIKGVHCLPKQLSFIIDVSGNILEAEAIVVKKREE